MEYNKWEILPPSLQPRHSCTVASCRSLNTLYLIGGVESTNLSLIGQIEEYNINERSWRNFNLKNPEIYVPTELAGAIQFADRKILIFGGTDLDRIDSKNSYELDLTEGILTKVQSMKVGLVFLNPPYMYGDSVYCVGNPFTQNSDFQLQRYDFLEKKWILMI